MLNSLKMELCVKKATVILWFLSNISTSCSKRCPQIKMIVPGSYLILMPSFGIWRTAPFAVPNAMRIAHPWIRLLKSMCMGVAQLKMIECPTGRSGSSAQRVAAAGYFVLSFSLSLTCAACWPGSISFSNKLTRIESSFISLASFIAGGKVETLLEPIKSFDRCDRRCYQGRDQSWQMRSCETKIILTGWPTLCQALTS
jgi:hypothetical protein